MVTLDGSTLEGGGQLVRVALSLSAICRVHVHIYNIRAGRGAHSFYKRAHDGRRNEGGRTSSGSPNHGGRANRGIGANAQQKPGGGLKESHLAALRWLARECNAEVEGAETGSQELRFKPARRKDGHLRTAKGNEDAEVIELKNPGSVWLIWQAIFPYIVFSMLHQGPREGPETSAFRIRLKGGTNVPKSPSSEYMQQVLVPLCERIGLPKVDIQVLRRGWTTGAPEIGEVDIVVSQPKQCWEHDARKKAEVDRVIGKREGKAREDGVDESDGFVLAPFHLTSPAPIAITSISMTVLAGSPKTHSLLQSQLLESLRAMPAFSSPTLPIQLHPSSAGSGDERRLYILLVAHTSAGYTLGRDYLSPGRKVTNEAERQRTIDEAVGHVVRSFARECERGSCVDEFAEDQFVIFQALAEGASNINVGQSVKSRNVTRGEDTGSLHTRTVRWVCREMLGTVFDGQGRCEGRGMEQEEAHFKEMRDELKTLSIEGDHYEEV